MSNLTKFQTGLTLVLNGGSTEMDAATIPIKWFFSPKLAKKEPKFLLFVEQAEIEYEYNSDCTGRRYVVAVEEAVKFIQVFKSGHHRLLALVFDSYEKACVQLERDPDDNKFYRSSLPWQYLLDNSITSSSWGGSLAVTGVEFDVPKELFAHKPQTKISRALFDYYNWPLKDSKDECSMRKRKIFSLPKLPIYIAWNVIKLVFISLLELYMIVAPFLVWLFGFQPISLKDWWNNSYGLKDLFMGGEVCLRVGANWRGEKTKYLVIYAKDKDGWWIETKRRRFISPILLIVIISLIIIMVPWLSLISSSTLALSVVISYLAGIFLTASFVGRRFNKKGSRKLTSLTLIIGGILIIVLELVFGSCRSADVRYYASFWISIVAGVAIFLFFMLLIIFALIKRAENNKDGEDKKREARAAEARMEKEKKRKSYQKYLLKNFTVPEAKVNLKNLPDTFEKGQTARWVRIKFWATKAKVCKPFES